VPVNHACHHERNICDGAAAGKGANQRPGW
jgi:hypothetical protein